MKHSELKRGKPLERTTPLRAKPSKRRKARRPGESQFGRNARAAWARAAREAACASCGRLGTTDRPTRGHHVIYQQELRKLAELLGLSGEAFEGVLWNRQNMLPLCDLCHDRHHSGHRRIPLHLALIANPKILTFAERYDRVWYLERYYAAPIKPL